MPEARLLCRYKHELLVISDMLSLTVALHHAGDGGGLLGSWLGPIVIAVLVLAGLAWASRGRGR